MPQSPEVLAAAGQVEHDLGNLDMSTRTLLSLLRANQSTGGGGGTPETGLDTTQAGAGVFSTSVQAGWLFTNGPDPIRITAVRFYGATGSTGVETVRLWTGSVVASANITPVPGEWVEEAVTPYDLAAGLSLTVAARRSDSASRDVLWNPTTVTFNPAISFNGWRFTNTNGLPLTSTSTKNANVDFVFEMT